MASRRLVRGWREHFSAVELGLSDMTPAYWWEPTELGPDVHLRALPEERWGSGRRATARPQEPSTPRHRGRGRYRLLHPSPTAPSQRRLTVGRRAGQGAPGRPWNVSKSGTAAWMTIRAASRRWSCSTQPCIARTSPDRSRAVARADAGRLRRCPPAASAPGCPSPRVGQPRSGADDGGAHPACAPRGPSPQTRYSTSHS